MHVIRPLQVAKSDRLKLPTALPVAVKLLNNPWTIERRPWLSSTIDDLHDRLPGPAHPVAGSTP
jgi:hypothetical protein